MQHNVFTKRYKTERTAQSRVSAVVSLGFVVQVSIALAILLALLYVSETNGVVLSERSIQERYNRIFEAEQRLTKLQIEAARLQSASRVQEVATSGEMVFSGSVAYVGLNNDPVAFAR